MNLATNYFPLVVTGKAEEHHIDKVHGNRSGFPGSVVPLFH